MDRGSAMRTARRSRSSPGCATADGAGGIVCGRTRPGADGDPQVQDLGHLSNQRMHEQSYHHASTVSTGSQALDNRTLKGANANPCSRVYAVLPWRIRSRLVAIAPRIMNASRLAKRTHAGV